MPKKEYKLSDIVTGRLTRGTQRLIDSLLLDSNEPETTNSENKSPSKTNTKRIKQTENNNAVAGASQPQFSDSESESDESTNIEANNPDHIESVDTNIETGNRDRVENNGGHRVQNIDSTDTTANTSNTAGTAKNTNTNVSNIASNANTTGNAKSTEKIAKMSIDDLVQRLTSNLTHIQTDDFTKAQVEYGFAGTGVTRIPGVELPMAMDIDEYITRCEAAMTGKWSDAGKIALIKKYCYKTARTAAQLCEAGANGEYKTFKEALKKKFPHIVTHDQICEKLSQARREEGQTLECFMLHLQELVKRAEEKDPNRTQDAKASLVRTFLRQMPKRYINRVTDDMRNDPDKLLADAIEYVTNRPELKLSNEYILRNETPKVVMGINEKGKELSLPFWCIYHKQRTAHSSTDCRLGKKENTGKSNGQQTSQNKSFSRPQNLGHSNVQSRGRSSFNPKITGMNPSFPPPIRTPGFNANNHGGSSGWRNPTSTSYREMSGAQNPRSTGRSGPRGLAPVGSQGNSFFSHSSQQETEKTKCFKCQGWGHMSRQCPSPGFGSNGRYNPKRST